MGFSTTTTSILQFPYHKISLRTPGIYSKPIGENGNVEKITNKSELAIADVATNCTLAVKGNSTENPKNNKCEEIQPKDPNKTTQIIIASVLLIILVGTIVYSLFFAPKHYRRHK